MSGDRRRRYLNQPGYQSDSYVEVVHRKHGAVQLNFHRSPSKYELTGPTTYCFYLDAEQRLDFSRFLADVPNPNIIRLPDEQPESEAPMTGDDQRLAPRSPEGERRTETWEERLRREGKDVDDPRNYGVPHPDDEDGEP